LAINMGVTALRPNWIIGFVPHGGNVDQYLPVAVATVKAGMRVQYGQQFYEATVSYNDAHWRIQQAIAAGIPVKSIYIGMMNWVQGWSDAAPDHFWDVNTCVSNMQRFLAEWPALLGAAYWEAGRIARSQDSATYPDRVGTVLGLS
jgi:hypothetical protein